MGLDQLLDDSQSQPRPPGGPRARFVGPVETLKDVGQILGGDAGPRVLHTNLDPLAGGAGGNTDLPARLRVRQPVFEQIAQHLADPPRIHVHER